jgi:hypothetical protein
MDKRPWALITAVTIAAMAAGILSGLVLYLGNGIERLLALGVILLSLLQFGYLVRSGTDRSLRRRIVSHFDTRAKVLAQTLEALAKRVAVCEEELDQRAVTDKRFTARDAEASGAALPLTGELDDLRRSLRKLADDYGVAADAPPPAASSGDPLLADKRFRLELYLEPIVELKTDQALSRLPFARNAARARRSFRRTLV